MPRTNDYDRKAILEAIRELANGDSPPVLSEYEQHGPTSSNTVYNYFDSWNEAVKEAGYEPNQGTDVSREEMLEAIRELADEDTPPMSINYRQHGPTSLGVVYDRFDSWNEAVKEAGYEPNQSTDASREEILKGICELADEGTPPTSIDYKQHGPTSLGVVYDRFDSWSDAVDKAGFKPHMRHNVPREVILASVRELAANLSRPPMASEFDDRGITSSSIAKKRCGGAWKSRYFPTDQRHHLPLPDLVH